MREIQLTQGKVAMVDDGDYEWLSQWRWMAVNPSGGPIWYAVRQRSTKGGIPRKVLSMHRELLNNPEGMVIDHKDGNGLNNQRANLRVCTNSQNMLNAGIYSTNTSGFKGVYWEPRKRRWSARIEVQGKKMRFGTYSTKEEAAKAYEAAAIKFGGEFARTVPFEGRQ